MTFQNVGNEKRAFDKALLSEPRGLWPRRAEIWWDRRLQDWKETAKNIPIPDSWKRNGGTFDRKRLFRDSLRL